MYPPLKRAGVWGSSPEFSGVMGETEGSPVLMGEKAVGATGDNGGGGGGSNGSGGGCWKVGVMGDPSACAISHCTEKEVIKTPKKYEKGPPLTHPENVAKGDKNRNLSLKKLCTVLMFRLGRLGVACYEIYNSHPSPNALQRTMRSQES
jgi:hypothetical protein